MRSLALLVTGYLVVAVLASGCTAPAEPGAGSESASTTAPAACEAAPERFVVILSEGICTPIDASGGRWTPAPLFPGVAAMRNACVYSWTSPESAPPDAAALRARVAAAPDSVVRPSCGPAAVGVGTPSRIPYLSSALHAGTRGCDVCGQVEGDEVLVVLENAMMQEFAVEASDGSVHSFRFAFEPGAQALTIPLPPPPAGAEWVQGPVTVY